MTKSRDNFIRLAESRTNKTLKLLELIGNLSNRSNYTYSDEDAQKIFRAINRKLREVEMKFSLQSTQKRADKFKL